MLIINIFGILSTLSSKSNFSSFLPFFLLQLVANLVLHRTIERIHVGKKYGDIPRGIFVVRGENVVLLGEIVSKCKLNSFMKFTCTFMYAHVIM